MNNGVLKEWCQILKIRAFETIAHLSCGLLGAKRLVGLRLSYRDENVSKSRAEGIQ